MGAHIMSSSSIRERPRRSTISDINDARFTVASRKKGALPALSLSKIGDQLTRRKSMPDIMSRSQRGRDPRRHTTRTARSQQFPRQQLPRLPIGALIPQSDFRVIEALFDEFDTNEDGLI